MTDGAIRTPSTVAHQLMYATARDLTSVEQAYLFAYHRITNRVIRAKEHAWAMFGKTSKTAQAAIWQAEQEEKIDLARALATFENAEGLQNAARQLGVL